MEKILAEQKEAKESDGGRIGDYIYFLYVFGNEVTIEQDDAHKARYALKVLNESLSHLSAGKVAFYERLKDMLALYDNELKYKLISERNDLYFKKLLKNEVKYAIEENSDIIRSLKKDIELNRDVLESIENETGLTSLFSGMKDYSRDIKKKLRKINSELRNIKYLLFFTPVTSAIFYLTVDVHYGFFLSTLSVMVVLGYFLKVSLRKEDQYEQILAKVENRIAIAIFHRYQLGGMGDKESEIANEKFHSFIYKELETSDWNAPDISEGVLGIIKEVKR